MKWLVKRGSMSRRNGWIRNGRLQKACWWLNEFERHDLLQKEFFGRFRRSQWQLNPED